MKRLVLAVILLGTMGFYSCGEDKIDVERVRVRELVQNKPFTVRIRANINEVKNPEIFIRARNVKLDRSNMTLTVENALISDYNSIYMFGISIDEAKFSFPLGGGKIEIWGPGDKYQKITATTFEERLNK